MTIADLLSLAQKLSSVSFGVLLFLILIGSYKRMWVWGWQLEEVKASRDQWQQMALRGTALAETSVGIAKSARVS
ncbi:MAG: hypothetical protein V4529_16910 [Gemmatimonadota bacterium]